MSVAVRVIPCLDVDAGRVVKGVNFENLREAGDPVELARRYGDQGADELTFLDVTASSGERATMLDVVRRTAEQVFIPLTVGGGIRSTDDIDTLLRAGADKVSINTAALALDGFALWLCLIYAPARFDTHLFVIIRQFPDVGISLLPVLALAIVWPIPRTLWLLATPRARPQAPRPGSGL